MKVKNQKCIRTLSRKSLWASRKRNMIAIFAIALTTLLFTSLFTIALSINASYETYNFRQMGGYSHGTFKDVTEEQAQKLSVHSGVKETGRRTVCGFISDGVFGKVPAEVSYMDKNCTKWSYAEPTTGREPEKADEIAMDTTALKLLGITPKLGAQVKIGYQISNGDQTGEKQEDIFTLVGYWDFDDLMPVHYLNVSEKYISEIEKECVAEGMDGFRIDLNVMLPSTINIEGQLQRIDSDLGYDWTTRGEENSVRIGVNWALTTSQAGFQMDPELIAAIVAFLLLVMFTGYLIIYNIFQISVSGDIRFYGLLKTIGTTPRQLKRIIRQQALLLGVVGIPIGLVLGYIVGAVLTPVALKSTTVITSQTTISTSPWIFAGAAVFSLVTVFLSSAKPGKLAAKVSPVEAAKYAEAAVTKKKQKKVHGAKVYQMAFANLGRGKRKTVLVIASLALSVTLFNVLCSFVGGFDMEKYLESLTCADFVVSSTDYFRYNAGLDEYIPQDVVDEIKENTKSSLSGCSYTVTGNNVVEWMDEDIYQEQLSEFLGEDEAEAEIALLEHRENQVSTPVNLEGLDRELFDKLTILEGDLAPLFEENTKAIAVCVDTDDYGNIVASEKYPKVGDTVTVTYTEEAYDIDYTVCALVTIPYAMSFRYQGMGHDAVIPVEKLRRDSNQNIIPLFYLFDTPDTEGEEAAENYLAELTSADTSAIMYESKAIKRAEFTQFQNMFFLLGGVLCAVIGIVGILNFFNAVMTGILARKREFAVLQAVGMTNRQLKKMLVYEGLFYALGAVAAAFVLSVIISPLLGNMMSRIFWFFTYHFIVLPVVCMIPVFALLGWLIPTILYGQTAKESIVERLRDAE